MLSVCKATLGWRRSGDFGIEKVRETFEVEKVRETFEVEKVRETFEVEKVRETFEVEKVRETLGWRSGRPFTRTKSLFSSVKICIRIR